MEVTFAADVFAKMAVDDAVDVLNEFDKDKVASFLTIMDNEAANEIKHLLHYEEKTAGSIMTTEYVAFFQKQKRSEEHTSELQSRGHLVCRLLLEKKKKQ